MKKGIFPKPSEENPYTLIFIKAPRFAVLTQHQVVVIQNVYLQAYVAEGLEAEGVFYDVGV